MVLRKFLVLRMARFTFSTLLLFAVTISFAQDIEIGETTTELKLRKGPGTTYPIIATLKKGCKVTIIRYENDGKWCYVNFEGVNSKKQKVKEEGFVATAYLDIKIIEDMTKYPKVQGIYGTEELEEIGCMNILPSYDYNNECSLLIDATTANYDTIFKICRIGKQDSRSCVRMVYVRAGTTHEVKHIPYGIYYFKEAVGTDLRQKIDENGNCLVKFAKYHQYYKTQNTFQFSFDGESYEGWEYKLKPRTFRKGYDSVSIREISEKEFNQ